MPDQVRHDGNEDGFVSATPYFFPYNQPHHKGKLIFFSSQLKIILPDFFLIKVLRLKDIERKETIGADGTEKTGLVWSTAILKIIKAKTLPRW
jgi:hypothetical protein